MRNFTAAVFSYIICQRCCYSRLFFNMSSVNARLVCGVTCARLLPQQPLKKNSHNYCYNILLSYVRTVTATAFCYVACATLLLQQAVG